MFVLYEVFGYAHTEIVGILDRSPRAVCHRAQRRHNPTSCPTSAEPEMQTYCRSRPAWAKREPTGASASLACRSGVFRARRGTRKRPRQGSRAGHVGDSASAGMVILRIPGELDATSVTSAESALGALIRWAV